VGTAGSELDWSLREEDEDEEEEEEEFLGFGVLGLCFFRCVWEEESVASGAVIDRDAAGAGAYLQCVVAAMCGGGGEKRAGAVSSVGLLVKGKPCG
jgi:hypothetical protein